MAEKTDTINPKTAERLKALLEDRGCKQKELAAASGFSPAAVSKWLSGDAGMSKEAAEKCAEHLGCSPAYLLGYTDFMTYDDEMKAREDRSREERELLKKRKKKLMDVVLMAYMIQDEPSIDRIIMKKKKPSAQLAYLPKEYDSLNMLSDALLEMVDTYVDNFIKQHPPYIMNESEMSQTTKKPH